MVIRKYYFERTRSDEAYKSLHRRLLSLWTAGVYHCVEYPRSDEALQESVRGLLQYIHENENLLR